ncbi:MAG: hypothetical protein IKY76_01365 [Alistipes sp.]|nr:hypothetical protein [Alistipes sp.]
MDEFFCKKGEYLEIFIIFVHETRAIPAFVGADIAGAIIGACVNGGIQYLNKKEIDGESLLYAAVGSAIVGSTGIVGKLGNWLTNLMNTML